MQKHLTLLACLVLALATTRPALADTDAAGAQALKQVVEQEIAFRRAAAAITGKDLTTGPVAVTPKGAFYEVKIPAVVATLGPKGKINVGDVTLNATPGKTGEWMVSLALPAHMTVTDRADQVLATVTIGKQKFAGAWNAALGFFPRYEGQYENIAVTGPDAKDFKIAAARLHLVSNIADDGQGFLAGKEGAELENLTIDTDANGNTMHAGIGHANTVTSYTRMNAAGASALRAQIAAAAPADAGNANETLTAFISALLPAMRSAAGDVSTAFEATTISFAGRDATAANQMDIAKASGASSLNGLDQDKAQGQVNIRLDGIKSTGLAAALMPETVNLDVSAGNLPARKVIAALADTLQKSIALMKTSQTAPGGTDAVAKLQMTTFVSSLPQTLQEAGAFIDIKNSYARNADVDMALDGRIVANAAAINGATGKLVLTVTGLENAAQKMREAAAQPGADPNMALYANGLMAAGMTGLIDRAPDGRLIHRYTFEITDDNKMLLNNMNLQQVIAPAAQP